MKKFFLQYKDTLMLTVCSSSNQATKLQASVSCCMSIITDSANMERGQAKYKKQLIRVYCRQVHNIWMCFVGNMINYLTN